jgi:arginine-tRNA-protein transferase
MSARISSSEFKQSKTQKRIRIRNEDVTRVVNLPLATDPQYDLFKRYINARHPDGGMSDMDADDFTAMIEETNVESQIVEYYVSKDGIPELISFSLVDILDDGISMVYSVFDPDMKERSLGTYMIMDHNDLALEMKLKFVYLGYWVKGSSKMDYKKRFSPLQVFTDDKWVCATKVVHRNFANEIQRGKKQSVPIYLPSDQ